MQSKRGQVTLFIILAIIIVAIVVLAIIFVPKLFPGARVPAKPTDPQTYIGDCINLVLEPMVENISAQGGYIDLGNCVFYKDYCRHYLCYSTTPPPCQSQEPLLKEHVEQVLKAKLQQQNVITNCINSFTNAATQQGYEVSVCAPNQLKFNVTLTEGKVNVPINCSITMTKGNDVRKVDKIEPFLRWPLYEFVVLTNRIISDEQQKGTFDYVNFMQIPQNRWVEISIERKTEVNAKIYLLKERTTEKTFGFSVTSKS